jgi:acetyl-CoA synthase
MSQIVVNLAVAGAKAAVGALEGLYAQALAEHGPETPVGFPDTAYHLPLIMGMTGQAVEKMEDVGAVLDAAKKLLPTGEAGLGEALDAGMATLYAAEAIQAIRYVKNDQPEVVTGIKGHESGYRLNGPISDVQLRTWGIQLVDGRMAGAAAIIGCAKSNEVAVKIVREFQRRNILCLLCGNVNGRSIIHQLLEEGVELGYDTYTVPFGTDTVSAIYALGFAARAAMTFGGMKGGQKQQILEYNRARVPAFVLALGGVDELKVAAAAGALNFGFPIISDTPVPEILATPVTKYEALVGMPFDEIAPRSSCRGALRCATSRSASPTCLCPWPTAPPSKAKWCARPTCASSSAARKRAASSTCACSTSMPSRTARSPLSAPT